jgi:hypothetical protein
MSEEQKKIIGFRINRASTPSTEDLQADECVLEDVPTYVFRHQGKEVLRIAVSELTHDPVPSHAMSPAKIQQLRNRQA